VAALQDPEEEVRRETAGALSKVGWHPPDEAHQALLAVAAQEWKRAVSLGEHAIEPLIAVLQYKQWAVRLAAARTLGEIGDTRAVEPLVAALRRREWDERKAAAEALGKIGDARAVGPLLIALQDQ
jgi:HEAT repeat protein